MITRRARRVAVVLTVLVLATSATAGTRRQQAPEKPQARSSGDAGIVLIDTGTTDVSLSHDGRWLAYPRRDPRDYYMDLWVSRPNGQGRRCLTCDLPEPTKHRGNVVWHPSGDFLVFSAENGDVRTRKGDRLAEPGVGQNTNLWAVTEDGTKAWRLTDFPTDTVRPRGVIHPRISPDGRRIVWAGPVDRAAVGKGYEWGTWALFFADIDTADGTPSLTNIRPVQPGAQHSYYEPGDWSPDGRHLLISANTEPGQSVSGLDIYEMDVETGLLRRLTRTLREWDQFPHYAADGRRILWASSRGLPRVRSAEGLNWRKELATELWVMNRDGSGARRLTTFNQPGSPDVAWFRRTIGRSRRVVVGDSAPLADANRVAATLAYSDRDGQWRGVLAILPLVESDQSQ